MYKRQVSLQKIFCMLALIASALVFVYSLGLVTDLYDALYTTMPNPKDHLETSVAGSVIFYDIQPFNQALMLSGLGLILVSLGLFLTNTHVRRRYYIGNYVATALWSVAAVVVAVWAHIQVEAFKFQFVNTVDFPALKAYAESQNKFYTESTFWFDAHYFVFGLLLVAVVVMVANLFWKRSLMQQEAALLAGTGSKAEAGSAAVTQ